MHELNILLNNSSSVKQRPADRITAFSSIESFKQGHFQSWLSMEETVLEVVISEL